VFKMCKEFLKQAVLCEFTVFYDVVLLVLLVVINYLDNLGIFNFLSIRVSLVYELAADFCLMKLYSL